MKPLQKIEIIESCEWAILKIDGKVFDYGHSIDFIDLLRYFGYDVTRRSITDEYMEKEEY